MKHIRLLSVAAILFFVFVNPADAFSQTTNTANESDMPKAIAAAARQMETGWNTKSGAAFAQPFAEDSDYVVINGMHIKGRAAIAAGHQGIFDTVYKDSTLSLTLENVRLLRPDVALAHVRSELRVTHGETTQTGSARITLVLTKSGHKWEIAAFQNTRIDDAQQKGGK